MQTDTLLHGDDWKKKRGGGVVKRGVMQACGTQGGDAQARHKNGSGSKQLSAEPVHAHHHPSVRPSASQSHILGSSDRRPNEGGEGGVPQLDHYLRCGEGRTG